MPSNNRIGTSDGDKNKKAVPETTIEMSTKSSGQSKNKTRTNSNSSSSSSSSSQTSISVQPSSHRKCSCSTPCLHLAAKTKNGNYEQMKSLLENGEDPSSLDENGRTPLHWLCLADCSCESCLVHSERCIKLLLNYISKDSLDIQDTNGQTPLHLAVECQNINCALGLITCGADYSIRNAQGQSSLQLMVQKLPELMVDLMNKSVNVEKYPPNNHNCILKVDFRPIIDPSPSQSTTKTIYTNGQRKELNILSSVLDTSQHSQNLILCHPLISTFLDLKWKRVRKYFVMYFVCYLFWLLSYTSYIVKVYLVSCPCDYFSSKKSSADNDNNNNAKMIDLRKLPNNNNNNNNNNINFNGDQTPDSSSTSSMLNHCFLQTGLTFEAGFLLFLTFIMAANEIFKIILIPNIYFKNKLNYCSWILISMVIITTGPIIMDKNTKPDPWQYEAAAFAIFLSWAMILVQIGTFPSFGRYVEILGHVLKNFGLSMLTFSALFIAFALSFNVLFPGDEGAFSHFFYAILKVLVMMAGEVDYQDMFYDKDNDSTKGPIIGHILYAAFVIIISIVLMNLLIGLTVSDIQTLQSQAEIRRISRQITETSLLETCTFSKKLPKFIRNFLSYDISVLKLIPPEKSSHHHDGSDSSAIRVRPNDKTDKSVPKKFKQDLLQIALKNYHKTTNSRCRRPYSTPTMATSGNAASLSSD